MSALSPALRRGTEVNQYLIASRVPMIVIDGFELVKLAQEERDRPPTIVLVAPYRCVL